MDNSNKDLLDLCKLNLMEDNIKESNALDRDIAIETIEWKRQQLVTKIINEAKEETKNGLK